MARLLERIFRFLQRFEARYADAPEAPRYKAPDPGWCPSCRSALHVVAVRPGLWGEERDYSCTNCTYRRMITVQYES